MLILLLLKEKKLTIGESRIVKQMIATKKITIIGLFTALLCVLSPLSIPIGPIPITLCTFFVMLSGLVLGWKYGSMSVILYLLLGVVGLPVFSGFTSGIGAFFGVAGGYMYGYIPLAMCAGISRAKPIWVKVVFLTVGNMLLYSIGTIWYMFIMEQSLVQSLIVCVFPFLIGDGIKIFSAIFTELAVNKALKEILF